MNLLFPNINLLSLTSFLTFSNIYLLFTHFTHAYTHTHKHTHTHTHMAHTHTVCSHCCPLHPTHSCVILHTHTPKALLCVTPPKALLCVTPHTHTQSTPVCYSTQRQLDFLRSSHPLHRAPETQREAICGGSACGAWC